MGSRKTGLRRRACGRTALPSRAAGSREAFAVPHRGIPGAMARGKTLFDVVFRMTNYGVESHVTRKCWLKHPGTFLRVTEVQPNPRVSSSAR